MSNTYSGRPEHPVRSAAAFGATIRYFRTQAGLTQAELAARSSTYVPRISDAEGGKTTRELERLMRILAALDLEVVIRKATA